MVRRDQTEQDWFALKSSSTAFSDCSRIDRAGAIGLGIDAGGTYTDAVLYDFETRKVLAKAKALTTYHALAEGIRNALAVLPQAALARVGVTSLSTTLATNAIVEGRGYKVGLIVLSPWDWTETEIDYQPMVNIPGAVSITGEVLEPLDEPACRQAIQWLVKVEHCAAIAVAGYATVRNPSQANRVREIVRELYHVPVVCAHEISRRLNMIHGAQTAIANARLLPIVSDLLDAVRLAMADFGIGGRLMVVKGDGTLVSDSVARERPVETILSGPAASVSGARLLAGAREGLIMDIGGTTTDCAIFHDGLVTVGADGARVGDWTMSVDAIEVTTVGLGGDSRIDFDHERRIVIGPVRNIPLACLAAEHASVLEYLRGFDVAALKKRENALLLDVLVVCADVPLELSERERQLLELVRPGPIPAARAAAGMNLPSARFLPLARLEACGMVKRSALTPTDLLHVTGQFARWNVEAARLALAIFAAMFGRPPDQVLTMIFEAFTRRIFEEIIRREVTFENRRLHGLPEDWSLLLNKAFKNDERGLDVKFALRRPLIAIGAPAAALVTPVKRHLEVEIIVPEHADVANAIGAIGGEIEVREQMLIRPGFASNYVLYGEGECLEFADLEEARHKAVAQASARARRKAEAAGACAPAVAVNDQDVFGTIADGLQIFIEKKILVVASGRIYAPPA